jgi:hypothetical protein
VIGTAVEAGRRVSEQADQIASHTKTELVRAELILARLRAFLPNPNPNGTPRPEGDERWRLHVPD